MMNEPEKMIEFSGLAIRFASQTFQLAADMRGKLMINFKLEEI